MFLMTTLAPGSAPPLASTTLPSMTPESDAATMDVLHVVPSRGKRSISSGILLLTPGEVAQMIRLRGAETVIVGIQPDVAFAMVQLGLKLEDVTTALDLEEGLAHLSRRSTSSA